MSGLDKGLFIEHSQKIKIKTVTLIPMLRQTVELIIAIGLLFPVVLISLVIMLIIRVETNASLFV